MGVLSICIVFGFLVEIFLAFQFQLDGQRHNLQLSMISGGRRALMGGNWKLNPTTITDATNLASELVRLSSDARDVDVVVFPPFPLLPFVREKLKDSSIKLGGQDVFYESSGAYTGAVSADLLKEVGSSYALIGHSERRTIFKEDDVVINRKVKKALSSGLLPVLCIGESKAEYEAGLNQKVCGAQLTANLDGISSEDMVKIAIAYEPVWAIGTGLVCPKEVAQQVHEFIRGFIGRKYGKDVADKVIIQYGGSVNAKNVKELMSMPDIDGCLVGGASLVADSFSKIIKYSEQ